MAKINYGGETYIVEEINVVGNRIYVNGLLETKDRNIAILSSMTPREACQALTSMFYNSKINDGIITRHNAIKRFGLNNGVEALLKILDFGESVLDLYKVIIYVLNSPFWKTRLLSLNSFNGIIEKRKIRRYFFIKEQMETEREKEIKEGKEQQQTSAMLQLD